MGEKKDGGQKKGDEKEGGPITVVLKVDMHCEGCAKKVRKSVEGVESVKSDSSNNKLTAVGKVDPEKLKARVESKTKKKVELVSPQPKKDKVAGSGAGDGGDGGDKKKGEEKKPKETTVILKIRLHCVGCIRKVSKIIRRIDGVEQVTIDAQKDLVTVKGTMDAKEMPSYLKEKLKRSVEIVPPKKEEKKEGKKEGGGGGGDKKTEKAKGGGEKESGEGGGEKGEKKEGVGKAEAHKMEYYPGPGYAVEYVHAPQMFSDENPNACSVM
ncbi:heavy metal-associated isoprenylated plant protein 3-like isoform X2 [Aristolochia californica]|uniref:heavy metal-associated isoprenylated plant protein 3-like isoform X2 n=1 Tax=Aristolochia californica TaxID=171875 RepID=UPI0035DF8151